MMVYVIMEVLRCGKAEGQREEGAGGSAHDKITMASLE